MTVFGTLTLLPTLTAFAEDEEQVVLTRKFVEGAALYAQLWPGRLRVLMHPAAQRSNDLDHVVVRKRELPFELDVCAFDGPQLAARIVDSALVLGGPDYRMPHLADFCRAQKIPCVNVTEYSLRTRWQIANVQAPSRLRFLRTAAWELNQERLTLRSISRAAGVQCNGTPTYSLYRRFSPDPLLYFDTRTRRDMFASATDMAERARRLSRAEPLTLAFSGRLIPMKGAEDLIDVAAQLKRRMFPFRFLIAGDGSSLPAMRERVRREGLHEVEFLGVLPFETGLMPLMRSEVDLFVACHRQGDPSCTYLETLAAGVPIIGYENEAFAGLLGLGEVGFGVPMNRPDLLAQRISELSRSEIIERSERGLRFARQHAFEKTFERRVEHLIEIAERWQLGHARPSSMPAHG
jgi:glycosyltransferase involved in cell wall biosynthesis